MDRAQGVHRGGVGSVSGNVVNLRSHRKHKERAAREAKAAENRTTYGRTKAERQFDARRSDESVRRHDGRRLDPDDEGPTPA